MNPPPNRTSILARLRNKAKPLGFPPDQMLLLYSLEGFLARLSVSRFSDQFVLKGGLSLYSRFGSLARPTRDIDLVMREIPDTPERMVEAVAEIAVIELGDGLEFDPSTITSRELNEVAEGIGINLIAHFGESQQTVYMDISSGSAITPGPVELAFPTLLGSEPHRLLGYPLETIVAEKFAAAIEIGVGNTRLKDFYDLLYILREELEEETLRLAIQRTFAARGTELSGSLVKWSSLAESESAARLWSQFLQKNRLEAPRDFAEVVQEIARVLRSVLE